MKIAEMEACHDRFAVIEEEIARRLAGREFQTAFSLCEESFPHIVPAVKYRKRRGIEPEMPALLSFQVICKYAPPLFEHRVLESLFEFVKSTRLLARHENGYLKASETALEHEEIARLLWNHLEQRPGAWQRDIGRALGLSQEDAVPILETWEELGVIDREQEVNSYKLYLRTRLDSMVEGICQTCGVRGKGRKEAFFKPTACGKCGTQGYYHIRHTSRQQC